jgi:hypothetical protein
MNIVLSSNADGFILFCCIMIEILNLKDLYVRRTRLVFWKWFQCQIDGVEIKG